jgi:hypothetical protein
MLCIPPPNKLPPPGWGGIAGLRLGFPVGPFRTFLICCVEGVEDPSSRKLPEFESYPKLGKLITHLPTSEITSPDPPFL